MRQPTTTTTLSASTRVPLGHTICAGMVAPKEGSMVRGILACLVFVLGLGSCSTETGNAAPSSGETIAPASVAQPADDHAGEIRLPDRLRLPAVPSVKAEIGRASCRERVCQYV